MQTNANKPAGFSRPTIVLAIAVILLVMGAFSIGIKTDASSAKQGLTGAQGRTGLQGLVGEQGPAGTQGTQGPAGPRGLRGLTGATGATGASGTAASIKTGPQVTYHMDISDFENSLIETPTSNLLGGSTTVASSDFAGTIPIYDVNNTRVGTYSASFLSMETGNGVFTDISNYLSTGDGLDATWATSATPINLALDSIVNSVVTTSTVTVTTKVGSSSFFGETFNLIVSSDGNNIYFQFNPVN